MRPHTLELHLERRDTALVCPRCQGNCARIKEGRQRCLRDLPILDRPVTLRLHLKRFQGSDCHHRPWEQSETFGERVQWTERLSHHVRQEYLHGCPCHELASRYGLSARTVCRWTFEKSHGGRPRKLGRALGIDAYARRKGHCYNTIIVDLDKGRPITTFTGRRVEDVVAWFTSRPQAELERVEVVVLDMSKALYASIHQVFGDQVEVIDRCHVVQQAVGALDGVWRSIKTQLEPEEAKELKKLRKRWLKLPNQWEVDELMARADWRRRFPALREVIDWVQDLRKWFERKYNKPARTALGKLIEQARESALAPLQGVAGTLSRWFEPMARYIRHRYTNGMTEGFNNKIKLIQRRAFGLRNEHNRKRRILADCART
ncbi:MAG TPA: ISL3 family transposase [Candidatus Acidoferrum sp.]|nr:ISL3 family transposase [Candidatus Acidoferrum sp.]